MRRFALVEVPTTEPRVILTILPGAGYTETGVESAMVMVAGVDSCPINEVAVLVAFDKSMIRGELASS